MTDVTTLVLSNVLTNLTVFEQVTKRENPFYTNFSTTSFVFHVVTDVKTLVFLNVSGNLIFLSCDTC